MTTVVSSTRSKRCHIGLVLPLCSCESIHLVSIDKFDTISTNQPTTWQMGSALVNYWHARLVCFSFSKLRNPPPRRFPKHIHAQRAVPVVGGRVEKPDVLGVLHAKALIDV